SAIVASKRLDLSKTPDTADSVLALFKNHGFTKSQVSKVILSCPKILLCDLEKTLLPNFKILNSLGFSNADLVAIVISRPRSVLQGKFHETALLSVGYLRSVLGSDDRVINAIKRFPQVLTYDLQVYGAENIQLLLEIGVPELRIKSMLAQQPRTFFTSADRFRTVVGNVKKMGIDPSKARFLWAIHAFRAMSKETWDKKVELYKKWGWSEDEILSAFERNPGCMMSSMDKITRILDFLVNTMGWDKSYIVQSPIIMCYSVEKRIVPRSSDTHIAATQLINRKDVLVGGITEMWPTCVVICLKSLSDLFIRNLSQTFYINGSKGASSERKVLHEGALLFHPSQFTPLRYVVVNFVGALRCGIGLR
ncbi:hypothetical protein M8C21_026002, partial [Ambrosia artemisiifolia]